LVKTYKKQIKDREDEYTEQYLIDEVYERTYKSHLERIYCSRFMRSFIDIDTLVVDIDIVLNKIDERRKRIKKQIRYILGETGYPQSEMKDFFNLNPDLSKYTGEKIKEHINNNSLQDA
jgi:hypothetical protein